MFGLARGSSRRPDLFDRLRKYIEDAKVSGAVRAIILDGSFTSAKSSPDDIDLIAVLDLAHDFDADLGPLDYNVLSRKRCRRIYGFDVVAAVDGGEDLEEFVGFFAQVKGSPGLVKGLVRLQL
jgi:hypothetical protein